MTRAPQIENAEEMAVSWECYQGETRWSRAARRFGQLGGFAAYWCGMPGSASAIPLTFTLMLPDGTELHCDYRLKDIHAAIETLLHTWQECP